jgi:hypothetical protein
VSPRSRGERVCAPRLQSGRAQADGSSSFLSCAAWASGRPLNSSVRSRRVPSRPFAPRTADAPNQHFSAHRSSLTASFSSSLLRRGTHRQRLSPGSTHARCDRISAHHFDGRLGYGLADHLCCVPVRGSYMPLLWRTLRSTPNGCVLASLPDEVRRMRLRCHYGSPSWRLLTIVGGGRERR